MAEPTAEMRLRRDVETLAGTIGERHVWRPASLAPAAEYIRAELRAAGYTPAGQAYDVHKIQVENIEAVCDGLPGRDEIVVIGAHYDSVQGCPGANDNASGVAAMLELARRFGPAGARRLAPPARTIRFVAFVNEEPPFFQTAQMGSVVYASAARARGDRIVAMLSLETIGYYSQVRGSQTYPAPLDRMYPDTGNFIGMVSNLRSAGLLRQVTRAFRAASSFPLQAAPAPEALPGVGWSDQWAFWQAGYRAVMITDTAPYRYPWYHTPHDTPDKVMYPELAAVVDGLEGVVSALSR